MHPVFIASAIGKRNVNQMFVDYFILHKQFFLFFLKSTQHFESTRKNQSQMIQSYFQTIGKCFYAHSLQRISDSQFRMKTFQWVSSPLTTSNLFIQTNCVDSSDLFPYFSRLCWINWNATITTFKQIKTYVNIELTSKNHSCILKKTTIP